MHGRTTATVGDTRDRNGDVAVDEFLESAVAGSEPPVTGARSVESGATEELSETQETLCELADERPKGLRPAWAEDLLASQVSCPGSVEATV